MKYHIVAYLRYVNDILAVYRDSTISIHEVSITANGLTP